MTDALEPSGLLSEEAAAAYLGDLPLTTLRNLVRRKQIEHVKIGRTTSFKREHLDAYIDAHTVKTIDLPWGLTESSLRTIREGRPAGRRRTT